VAALVRYLREELGRERVVLMGHSTGCQGVMEFVSFLYSAGGERGDDVRIDGAILQGPVSDREAIALAVRKAEEEEEEEEGGVVGGGREREKKLRESVRVAEELVRMGKGDEIMRPEVLPLEEWRVTPVSAYRWFSLAGEG
jgi:pimeloyl-ACP methyl ester carboxylesterase